jgi:hypothetical protein
MLLILVYWSSLCLPLKDWGFQGKQPLFGKKMFCRRGPQASFVPCVCVPSPSRSLAGKAVQSKHRFSAPQNIRLGSTEAARQPHHWAGGNARFMQTSPGHLPDAWVPELPQQGCPSLVGGTSITCTIWSLSGWFGMSHHYHSPLPDLFGLTSGGNRRWSPGKISGQWGTVVLCIVKRNRRSWGTERKGRPACEERAADHDRNQHMKIA